MDMGTVAHIRGERFWRQGRIQAMVVSNAADCLTIEDLIVCGRRRRCVVNGEFVLAKINLR